MGFPTRSFTLIFLALVGVVDFFTALAFCPTPCFLRSLPKCPIAPSKTKVFLQTGLQIPLLDVLDDSKIDEDDDAMLTPLPSSHLPSEVATPFLYGMQVDRPVHKLLIQDATSVSVPAAGAVPMYGHLVWKGKGKGDTESLVGAIGCTAQILVHAPTAEVLNPAIAKDLDLSAKEINDVSLKSSSSPASSSSVSRKSQPSESPPITVLCRGGFRFVVKEVVKTIPYPVAIVDEIQDDAEVDDSDMFAVVSKIDGDDDDRDEEDDDDEDAKYAAMSGAELLQKTMLGIQAVVSQKLQEANAKQLSPLEKQILESSGITIDPNAMEQARAEEMAAVWDVFQASLVDDIAPHERKFAVAILAAELADMNNDIRQQVLLTRDAEERLRIVLKQLDEIVGMTRARKLATQITEKLDGDDKDLTVGKPQLPSWAKSIVKGTRVEYFWNEEYGWIAGRVVENPVTVVDEILLTILFDDGETHTLPLSAEDKVRWRPPEP